jgi:hypothetical protein
MAASLNKTLLSFSYVTYHGPLTAPRKLLRRNTVRRLRTANTNTRHVTWLWATDTHVHASHLRNHTLTPWSRIFTTNIVTLLKKFGAQYRTRRFTTLLTTARNWPLSSAIWSQSTLSHAIHLRSPLPTPPTPSKFCLSRSYILIFVISVHLMRPFLAKFSGLFLLSLIVFFLDSSLLTIHERKPVTNEILHEAAKSCNCIPVTGSKTEVEDPLRIEESITELCSRELRIWTTFLCNGRTAYESWNAGSLRKMSSIKFCHLNRY